MGPDGERCRLIHRLINDIIDVCVVDFITHCHMPTIGRTCGLPIVVFMVESGGVEPRTSLLARQDGDPSHDPVRRTRIELA